MPALDGTYVVGWSLVRPGRFHWCSLKGCSHETEQGARFHAEVMNMGLPVIVVAPPVDVAAEWKAYCEENHKAACEAEAIA